MSRKFFGRLIIHLDHATDLPNSDYFGGASDPYCLIKLDDDEIGRTQVWANESSPAWDEEFYANLNGEVENIIFEIWDQDTAQKDDLLSSVVIPITDIAATRRTDDVQESKKTIDLLSPKGEPAGTLSYDLKFREFGGEFAQFTGDGTKKSVHIGINYINKQLGKGGVHGCHKDVDMLYSLLSNSYGFSEENMQILRDDEESTMPTRRNIEKAIKWLVSGAKSGDSLVFQYSGHGGQQKDKNGDEDDGMDETILPYDHEKAGQITDDELFRMLVKPLPSGVLLTAIMDCCHSGTSIDLPFIHKTPTDAEGNIILENSFSGFIEKEKKKVEKKVSHSTNDDDDDIPAVLRGKAKRPGRKGGRRRHVPSKKKGYDNTSDASVIMISGCLDDQTSAGTIEGGAMVLALTAALRENSGNISYEDLIERMAEILKAREFSQIPQLSTARPFNLQSNFKI